MLALRILPAAAIALAFSFGAFAEIAEAMPLQIRAPGAAVDAASSPYVPVHGFHCSSRYSPRLGWHYHPDACPRAVPMFPFFLPFFWAPGPSDHPHVWHRPRHVPHRR